MKKKIYHSALHDDLVIDKEVMMCKDHKNIVFQHDICNGLASEYNDCDILYSEPAWLDGYQKFMERAGVESDYNLYLSALGTIAESTEKPLWIIIGKHAHKKLPTPHRTEPVKIHNYWTTLLGWNDDNDYSFNSNYDFIDQISNHYQCVGDFCCGYGNTGKAFKEKGKRFVMSDINGKCVYFISQELFEYGK